jgi:hypothetical protein
LETGRAPSHARQRAQNAARVPIFDRAIFVARGTITCWFADFKEIEFHQLSDGTNFAWIPMAEVQLPEYYHAREAIMVDLDTAKISGPPVDLTTNHGNEKARARPELLGTSPLNFLHTIRPTSQT